MKSWLLWFGLHTLRFTIHHPSKGEFRMQPAQKTVNAAATWRWLAANRSVAIRAWGCGDASITVHQGRIWQRYIISEDQQHLDLNIRTQQSAIGNLPSPLQGHSIGFEGFPLLCQMVDAARTTQNAPMRVHATVLQRSSDLEISLPSVKAFWNARKTYANLRQARKVHGMRVHALCRSANPFHLIQSVEAGANVAAVTLRPRMPIYVHQRWRGPSS